MGKKKEIPQEVKLTQLDMDRQLQQQRDMMFQASLILATSQMASQAVATGKTPQEVVQTMSKTYELMQDWFKGTPIKEQITTLLESILPERYY